VIDSNFNDFHNTEKKIMARRLMLEGKWPGDGCESCEKIENSGGFSDRQFQNQVPGVYPMALETDSTTVNVLPTVLELFFTNKCNFKCLYCNPQFSSSIQEENAKFGGSIIGDNNFKYVDNRYQDLVPKFWKWFHENSQKLQRLQLFGGEPFLQEDVLKIIDYLQQTPHPGLELNILTNLSIPTDQLNTILTSLSTSKNNNSLKRVDIQASLESWGPEQEYVRFGFDGKLFETNMQSMISMNSFRIGFLSTVNSLSINSMPELCNKYLEWNKLQPIFWYMHLVLPDDSVFNPVIFDYSVFEKSINRMTEMLPKETGDDQTTYKTFMGIASMLEKNCSTDIEKQHRLVNFLIENDRRKNTNWKITFPWLVKVLEKNNVI